MKTSKFRIINFILIFLPALLFSGFTALELLDLWLDLGKSKRLFEYYVSIE